MKIPLSRMISPQRARGDVLSHDQQIGVADLFADEGFREIAVRADSIPMPLVEVPRLGHLRVTIPQPQRLIRIALHRHPTEIRHVRTRIHPSADLVDQRRFIEWRRLLSQRKRQAIVSKRQDIHLFPVSAKIRFFGTRIAREGENL